jgi:signal transduction histidine kinase
MSYFGGIVLVFLSGKFFANKALKPVSTMVDKVEEITATNLDLRINEGNGRDELAELAITFNAMLDRLEGSFDAQKEFVSNISHELRTPLAAMLAELQLTLSGETSNEEYKRSIEHAIGDGQRLVRLTNGLLDLAKANYDQTEISFRRLRLDEILLDARNDVLHDHPDYNVNIIFEREIEDDNFISVSGNEYLLKVAFKNLIDNGCKFSECKESAVAITYSEKESLLHFRNKGVGIQQEELSDIFTPFYRGKNQRYAGGVGIGLSLTKRIIHLHNGTIAVVSTPNKETVFTVGFPHIRAIAF